MVWKLLYLTAITCYLNFSFGSSCSIGSVANDFGEIHRIDDMLLPKRIGRSGLIDKGWPEGVVIYKIDSSVYEYSSVLKNVEDSIEEISSKTCVTFRKAKSSDTYWLKYWMNPDESDCSSYIGWLNKKDQLVNLSPSCSKGNLIHETLHALGFMHEHTRNDRDDFVTINWENIEDGYEHNFIIDSESGYQRTSYYNVAYNYESILHYGPTTFNIGSSKSKTTIDSEHNPKGIGDDDNMGQRKKLSAGDIKMINNKYNCTS